jgi:hypothetical protein
LCGLQGGGGWLEMGRLSLGGTEAVSGVAE